jgi:nucleoside-diphosphate-sugar epimerase
MKVLLLGGTGAIGSFLIEILEKNQINTVITSRCLHDSNEFITYVKGNAKDMAFLSTLCSKKWDVIVDFMSYSTLEFSKERRNLLLNSTSQYIYLSSCRVFANSSSPITENSDRLLDVCQDRQFLDTDEYALAKARQEDNLSGSDFSNWTIVRPYITYGSSRFQLGVMEKEEWLNRALQRKTVVFPKDLLQKNTTMTHGKDVAMGIYSVMGDEKQLRQKVNLMTSHHKTWAEIIEIYKKLLKTIAGIDLKLKYVGLNEFLSCRSDFLKYQLLYDRLYNRVFDTSKQKTVMGDYECIPVEVGLSDCLQQFFDQGCMFKKIILKNEARKDRLTKEISSFKDFVSLKEAYSYFIWRFVK